MRVVLLFAFASLVAASAPDLAKKFRQWTTTYEKEYETGAERLHRFEVWSANRAFVNAHNAEEEMGFHTYRMKLNHLGDLSAEEYRSDVLGYKRTHLLDVAEVTFQPSAVAAPDSMDWRTKGVVNKVKDQAQCGSCWAFSAVAAMEGAYNMKSNGTVDKLCAGNTCGPDKTPCCSFSEQEIVDCTLNGADTCNKGGDPADGVKEVAKNMKGVSNTEKEYPYTSGGGTSTGKCSAKSTGVQTGITGLTTTKSGDEAALKVASSQHVLSIGIDASQQSFQFYSSGVYVEPHCKNGPNDLDHGVAIVGYGIWTGPAPRPSPGPADCVTNSNEKQCTAEGGCHWCSDWCSNIPCGKAVSLPRAHAANTTGQDYWLVRNSWGEVYGMDGYILMARNKDNQCGVATAPLFADVGSVETSSTVIV